MVVCENYLVVLWTENSDWTSKKNLKYNHNKPIHGPLRGECSSCRVTKRTFAFSRICSWNKADNVISVSNFVSRLNVIWSRLFLLWYNKHTIQFLVMQSSLGFSATEAVSEKLHCHGDCVHISFITQSRHYDSRVLDRKFRISGFIAAQQTH